MFDEIDWNQFENSDFDLLADCWSLKGFISNASARYDEAVKAATNGLAIKPTHVQSLHVRGYARIHLGNYAQAVADLQQVLELSSDPAKQRQVMQLLHTIRSREETEVAPP